MPTDRNTDKHALTYCIYMRTYRERERQRETETERQRKRERERQRQTDRQGKTEKDTERELIAACSHHFSLMILAYR